MTILVTGGAGFIGSNFIIDWIEHSKEEIVNLDKLTYAGNLENLSSVKNSNQYLFKCGDICDQQLLNDILFRHNPRAIINFAAESHVDRSIDSPETFIQTNIIGTYRLLDSARIYWSKLTDSKKATFRFLHVSTDEIYGSLTKDQLPFVETNRVEPNSPYAATKAASDHLVRAWYHTYGLPVITTNCSNNYGPYQFPEKLIPLVIINALSGKPLPIYGDGQQVRDWIYVKDHCNAISCVLQKGHIGEVYNIGGWNEKPNIEIVNYICDILDKLQPKSDRNSYRNQIKFVSDRPGHDRRYAIDANKISNELEWKPEESFESGIKKTVQWYLDNITWVKNVQNGSYQEWINKHYK